VSRPGFLVGALVAGAATVLVLVVSGGSTEGTVVAKTGQAPADYAFQAGGTMTGPVAVPAWGTCATPRCWQLVVRSTDGTTSAPCTSRAEYDRTSVGAFWHGRTDR
jgi:hypothetical protein